MKTKIIDTEIGTSYGHGERVGVPYRNPNPHTPGKWKVMADPCHPNGHPYHQARYITTADATFEEDGIVEVGELIAVMRDGEHQAGNAALIAAAPDLLKAAKALTKIHKNPQPMGAHDLNWRALIKAIAQAEKEVA